MKKILITGASGFFGRSVIESLTSQKENFDVFCIYSSRKFEIKDRRFHWVQSNLLDEEACKELIKEIKPTHCIHLAWHVPPQKFWDAFENIEWLYASLYLFKAFCENGGKTFIGAGTLAEYDWTQGALDEKATPLNPVTLYGQCKKSLHELIGVIRNTNYPNANIIWPRIGYFFGPYEPKQKLISKLIDSLKNNTQISLAPAEFQRSYAHVKYLGDIFAKILINERASDLVFNLSASKSYALKEIVEYIQKILKTSHQDIKYGTYCASNFNPLVLNVNTTVLKRELNYSIPLTFFDDIKTFLQDAI